MTPLERTALEQAKKNGFLSFPAKDFSVAFAREWDNWRWARRWPRIMVVSRDGTHSGPHAVVCDCAEAVPPVPVPATGDKHRLVEILAPPKEREGFEMLVGDECMALLGVAFSREFKDCGVRASLSYSSGPDAFMRSGMPRGQAMALARRAAGIVGKDRLSAGP